MTTELLYPPNRGCLEVQRPYKPTKLARPLKNRSEVFGSSFVDEKYATEVGKESQKSLAGSEINMKP
jgi:hypothetical protein